MFKLLKPHPAEKPEDGGLYNVARAFNEALNRAREIRQGYTAESELDELRIATWARQHWWKAVLIGLGGALLGPPIYRRARSILENQGEAGHESLCVA